MTTNLTQLPGNVMTTPATFAGAVQSSGGNTGPRVNPLVRYLAALRRFKWLVLLLALVGLGGGYLTSRLRPQSFEIHADLVIAPPPSDAGAIQANLLFSASQWEELFRKYDIIQPVAVDRQLYIIGPKVVGAPPPPPGPSGKDASLFNGFSICQPDCFTPGDYDFQVGKDGRTWVLTNTASSVKAAGAVGDSVGRKEFGFLWLPRIEARWYGQTFSFTILTPREAADDLNSRLHIDMDWRSARFMNLTLIGQDNVGTAETLNDLMKRYVDRAGEMKKHNLTIQAAILDTQLTRETTKLHEASMALQKFRVSTISLPRDNLSVAPGLAQTTPEAYNEFATEQAKANSLRKDRNMLARVITRATNDDSLVVDAFLSIPTVQHSPDLTAAITDLQKSELALRDLRKQYTDSMHSVIVAKTAFHEMLTQTVPRYARSVLASLDLEIAATDSTIQASKVELQGIPTRTTEEERLRRDEDTEAAIVRTLEERYTAARLVEASAVPDVSIMDQAVAPLRPSKNRKYVIIAMGAMAGLGIGLALALLFDVTDNRVRYADQITGGLGLTILGVIPEIKRAKGETPTPEEAAQVIEAFRTVRLNLSHTMGDGPVIFTISSPSPGDGKSLVSSNLALSFAEAGYRTVLIDGDTRRGELHRTFGLERRPGLLDHLSGELAASDLVRPTSHPQLRIVTAGSRKRNAPELLGSSRMRELINSMRSQFEVIIVDSPPLGAGIDPFVLATMTGNMLLVVRAGATERDLAETKLQIVDQLPIRMIGAILNDVRASMHEYKYYSYSYGYGAVEEGDEVPKLPSVLGSSS